MAKSWRHGIIEAKSDAGILFVASRRDFAAAHGLKLDFVQLKNDAIALKATVTAERAAATSLDIARRRLDLGDTTYVFVLSAELIYQQLLEGNPGDAQLWCLLGRMRHGLGRPTDAIAALKKAARSGYRPPTK